MNRLRLRLWAKRTWYRNEERVRRALLVVGALVVTLMLAVVILLGFCALLGIGTRADAVTRCPTPRDVPSWDHLARVETGPSTPSMRLALALRLDDPIVIGHRVYGAPRWHLRNGRYSGGLQNTLSTWRAFRGCAAVTASDAAAATPAEQISVNRHVLAVQGLRAWPVSTRKLGWR